MIRTIRLDFQKTSMSIVNSTTELQKTPTAIINNDARSALYADTIEDQRIYIDKIIMLV